jgi:hypothetical protein
VSAETEHILDTFRTMLEGPTGDGKAKRDAGTKPHWSIDPSHLRKGVGHLNKYLAGDNVDPDSGCHPLVHAAWRLLAVAWQDMAAQDEPTLSDYERGLLDMSARYHRFKPGPSDEGPTFFKVAPPVPPREIKPYRPAPSWHEGWDEDFTKQLNSTVHAKDWPRGWDVT